jgi:hypothetical protein
VDRNDLNSEEQYERQVHKHTFTCTKRGEKRCRFNIPYWPMPVTTVLCPLPTNSRKQRDLKKRAEELREILETKRYDTFEQFLADHGIDLHGYFAVIRASLRRPTIVFRRDMKQL